MPAGSVPQADAVAMPAESALGSLSLFGGRDPFKEFSPDPFSRGGIHSALSSGFGRAMEEMSSLAQEVGMPQMPFPQVRLPEPRGSYSIQTAAMSAFPGPDGRMHTEQFASSDVGHKEHDIRETHQAYSNSATGEEKRALEQHLGSRAWKSTRAQTGTQPELSTEMFLGMEKEKREEFDKDFAAKAHHLPEHRPIPSGLLRGSYMPLLGSAPWLPAGPKGALEGQKGGA